MGSWPNMWSECKSTLSAIARVCFLGREHWREKYKEQKKRSDELQEQVLKLEASNRELIQDNLTLRSRIAELEDERSLVESPGIQLPLDPPPPGQHYGTRMIELCVNLAREIGLRPTPRALEVVFSWLGVQAEIPCYQSIRGWMQRLGLDQMQQAEKVSDGCWLVDHTHQIGQEKVLAVMRIRESQLPPPGVPLRHQDVELLAVIPGKEWKQEDVTKVYQELIERYGVPRSVSSDGATELQEPAKNLGKPWHQPLVFRDPKHFLANQFKTLLRADPQYEKFTVQLAKTHPALQQTALAFLAPPKLKQKARFMNMRPTLDWASMVLWHLRHPDSRSRQGVDPQTITAKLGWLREFAAKIKEWQECQDVISLMLTFINGNGIFQGASKALGKKVKGHVHHDTSRALVREMIQFIKNQESQLKSHERLPISTEILESSFALYKHLEQQHAKEGFSSLLLTFPTLLHPTTPAQVQQSFARVKVTDINQWTKKYLAETITSKRQTAFLEARTKKKKRAITISLAA